MIIALLATGVVGHLVAKLALAALLIVSVFFVLCFHCLVRKLNLIETLFAACGQDLHGDISYKMEDGENLGVGRSLKERERGP